MADVMDNTSPLSMEDSYVFVKPQQVVEPDSKSKEPSSRIEREPEAEAVSALSSKCEPGQDEEQSCSGPADELSAAEQGEDSGLRLRPPRTESQECEAPDAHVGKQQEISYSEPGKSSKSMDKSSAADSSDNTAMYVVGVMGALLLVTCLPKICRALGL